MVNFPVVIPGSAQANGYLVFSDKTQDAFVIDPDLTGGLLENMIESCHLRLQGILLTHGHFDHISGVKKLKQRYPQARIYIHQLDGEMLTDPERNLSRWQGAPFTTLPADRLLEDSDRLTLGDEALTVLHTPGHTPGSVCYYDGDKLLFCGDTLFCMGIGRSDLPGGDGRALLESVKDKLIVLPNETQGFPGHGPATTIGAERLGNPFLREKS
jgi:hydroxyacylglutathione hydrolase